MPSQHLIQKSSEEKIEEFKNSFWRLQRANASYDQGNIFETGTIALNIFALLHDASKRQPSGLTVIGRKNGLRLVDTSIPLDPKNLLSEFPMCFIRTTTAAMIYQPLLGDGPEISYQKPPQSPTSWWNAKVIKSSDSRTYSRKNLVFHFRHERGGHIGANYRTQDNASAEDFAALGRENTGGWVWSNGEVVYEPKYGPEYATVRQIGWEVEKSILAHCPDIVQEGNYAIPTAMKPIK